MISVLIRWGALDSKSHQKPYKLPVPILVGIKALLGICSPLQSSGFFSLIHQGEDRTELVCSEGWNSISFECLEEQEHEVADGHQGAMIIMWWWNEMGLVSTCEMIKDWLRGGLSTSSKGKVPPPKKKGMVKSLLWGDGWFVEVFRSFRGGLKSGCGSIR